MVGSMVFTLDFPVWVIFSVSLRNRKNITGTVRSAPSSTAKKIPGLPFIQKKSIKSIFANAPSMIEVVSPTSVAAPCRLEETDMERTMGTGEILSSRQIATATGATISTVATLSMKAEISPANSDI